MRVRETRLQGFAATITKLAPKTKSRASLCCLEEFYPIELDLGNLDVSKYMSDDLLTLIRETTKKGSMSDLPKMPYSVGGLNRWGGVAHWGQKPSEWKVTMPNANVPSSFSSL